MFKDYYYLTKPGIIYGNAITTAAGFFLASRGIIDWIQLVATLVGISLIIGSACVWNNILDRKLDARMERTKNRSLVTGKISVVSAAIFAKILSLCGFALLYWQTNNLTCSLAFVGVVFYVAVYGFVKRRSVFGTIVGSISGAVPPVVGYTAVSNNLDLGAWILFAILVFWQMPHFYAISIFRQSDYQAANIPVLSIVKGMRITKINILFYIFSFILATMMLTVFSYTGVLYLTLMLAIGVYWFSVAYKGLEAQDDVAWARKVFRVSLVVLLVFNLSIVFDSVSQLIGI